MRRVVVLAVASALLLADTASGDEWDTERIRPPGYRSPGFCFGMAAVPGFAFHGLGNWTAGNRKVGGILFLTEVFGLGLMAVESRGRRSEDALTTGGTDNGFGTVGLALFYGSYAWDMMTAHEAAARTNARLRRNRASRGIGIVPIPSPRQDKPFAYPGVGFQRRF